MYAILSKEKILTYRMFDTCLEETKASDNTLLEEKKIPHEGSLRSSTTWQKLKCFALVDANTIGHTDWLAYLEKRPPNNFWDPYKDFLYSIYLSFTHKSHETINLKEQIDKFDRATRKLGMSFNIGDALCDIDLIKLAAKKLGLPLIIWEKSNINKEILVPNCQINNYCGAGKCLNLFIDSSLKILYELTEIERRTDIKLHCRDHIDQLKKVVTYFQEDEQPVFFLNQCDTSKTEQSHVSPENINLSDNPNYLGYSPNVEILVWHRFPNPKAAIKFNWVVPIYFSALSKQVTIGMSEVEKVFKLDKLYFGQYDNTLPLPCVSKKLLFDTVRTKEKFSNICEFVQMISPRIKANTHNTTRYHLYAIFAWVFAFKIFDGCVALIYNNGLLSIVGNITYIVASVIFSLFLLLLTDLLTWMYANNPHAYFLCGPVFNCLKNNPLHTIVSLLTKEEPPCWVNTIKNTLHYLVSMPCLAIKSLAEYSPLITSVYYFFCIALLIDRYNHISSISNLVSYFIFNFLLLPNTFNHYLLAFYPHKSSIHPLLSEVEFVSNQAISGDQVLSSVFHQDCCGFNLGKAILIIASLHKSNHASLFIQFPATAHQKNSSLFKLDFYKNTDNTGTSSFSLFYEQIFTVKHKSAITIEEWRGGVKNFRKRRAQYKVIDLKVVDLEQANQLLTHARKESKTPGTNYVQHGGGRFFSGRKEKNCLTWCYSLFEQIEITQSRSSGSLGLAHVPSEIPAVKLFSH